MKRRRCQWCGHPTEALRIPSMSKQGYDIVVGFREGLLVPAGASRPVFERRYKVGREILENPTAIKQVSASSVSIVTNKCPADFTAFPKRGRERFARIRTESNIQTKQGVIS